jgi:uncharacterized protein (TIGR02466 family)
MLKLFPGPFVYHDSIENHQDIKQDILPKIIEECENNKTNESYIWQTYASVNNNARTNFYNTRSDLFQQKHIENIIHKPLNKLLDSLYNENFVAIPSTSLPQNAKIKAIWWNVYKKGEYVELHNHGLFGLSGVYFIDLPDDEVNSTTFVYNNYYPLSDDKKEDFSLLYHNSEYVKEGDVLIFPSSLKHYVNPVLTTKVSISFNIELIF